MTYFSHYRAVNAFLDQCLLKAGLFLDRAGYQYITVAASQSMNQKGWNYQGRFSHKQAACAAGLGVMEKAPYFSIIGLAPASGWLHYSPTAPFLWKTRFQPLSAAAAANVWIPVPAARFSARNGSLVCLGSCFSIRKNAASI